MRAAGNLATEDRQPVGLRADRDEPRFTGGAAGRDTHVMSRSKRTGSQTASGAKESEAGSTASAVVSTPVEPSPAEKSATGAATGAAPGGAAATSPGPSGTAAAPAPRGFAAFIKWASSNTQFFSSVIIGGAGLIATSLYQCNQAKLAERQAVSQQKIATEQAINNWRIERAKILAQNLQTLTARGGDNAEQRYGVLLSLSRGNILDPDLAVTYALELGKDNPDYMASVLSNIEQKDAHHYRRLAGAYLPSCTQRYGVSVHGMATCKDDQYAERSRAIAEVIADDAEPQLSEPVGRAGGPLVLLRDEREVHTSLLRMVGLYGEFVEELYERRQWPTLTRLFQESTGASLVGSLNLLMQSSDLASATDLEAAHQLFADRERWLVSYVLSPSCDPECRGRVLNIVLSHLGRGQEAFRRFLRSVLGRPRGESSVFIHRLHGRLSYCQIDPDEYAGLRDQVIVPIAQDWVKKAVAQVQAAAAASVPSGTGKGPAGATGTAGGKTAPGKPTALGSPPNAATSPSAQGPAMPQKTEPLAGAMAPVIPALPSDPLQLHIDDLLGLLSLLPQPTEPSEEWKKLLSDLAIATRGRQPALFLARHGEEYKRRKTQAQTQPLVGPPSPQAAGKLAPSTSSRKSKNFCALTTQFEEDSEEEE